MATPYDVAIHLSASNGVSSVLAVIAKDVMGLHASVGKLQAGFAALKPAIIGAGLALAGTGMLKAMGHMVEKGNDLVKIQRDMTQAGVAATKVQEAYARAWELTGKNKNMSAVDIMKMINDARMTFGSDDHAIHDVDPFVQSASFLKSYQGGKHAGSGNILAEMNAAMKSGEIAGKITPETMTEHVKQLTAMKVAYGEQLKITEYLTAQRSGGVALRNSSDEFRYGIFPALVQENGSNAGVMMMTAFNKIVAGSGNRTQSLRQMERVGLLDDGNVEYDKNGRVVRLKNPDGIKGSHSAAENFPRWVMETLKPLLDKQTGGDHIKEAQLISSMFPDRNAAKAVTEVLQQWPKLIKDAEMMMRARGALDKGGTKTSDYNAGSLDYQVGAFKTQWENLMQALGAPMVATATRALASINEAIGGMAKWAAENPAAGQMLGATLAGLGAGLVALGAVLVGGALLAAIGVGGWLVVGIAALAGVVVYFRDQIADFMGKAEAWRVQMRDTVANFISDMGQKFVAGVMSLPGLVSGAISEAFAAIGAKISAAVKGMVGVAPGDAGDREGAAGAVGDRLRGRPVGPPPGKQSSLPLNNHVALYLNDQQVGHAFSASMASHHEHPTSAPNFDGTRGFMSPDGQFATA